MDPLDISVLFIGLTVLIALGSIILVWRNRVIEQEQQELNLQKDKFQLFVQYHAQGLLQARSSFNVSLLAAILGFVIIGIAIYFAVRPNAGLVPGILTGSAGVIVEAVSALFFTQSNRARKLMTDFFLQLGQSMRMDDSMKTAEKISEQNIKDRTHIVMALQFADVKISDENMRFIFECKTP